ncbi:MAG: hypothetical protein QXG16_04735 [Candidatus Anstonellaceae archaeon]
MAITRRELLVGGATVGLLVLIEGCCAGILGISRLLIKSNQPHPDMGKPTPVAQKDYYYTFYRDEKGILHVSQEGLEHLDQLKQDYPVDQWNQWGEGGTFDGVEITAGDARQNTIALDLWKKDDETPPWGNAEIKTLIHRGQSISLKEGFAGTGWVYPQDAKGRGWTDNDVWADSIAGLSRRTVEGENIANVLYIKLNENTYALLQVLPDGNSRIIWQGKGDPRDDGMLGVRGFVPLQALIDLGFAKFRH